ncbi:MAG: hypothetical protein C4324_08685 [Blastocatellia bacterium]
MILNFSFVKTAFLLIAILVLNAAVQTKSTRPAPPPRSLSRSMQILLVSAKNWSSMSGTAQLFERKIVKSKWRPSGSVFPVLFGRGGLAPAENEINTLISLKKEGDGKSPAGAFPLIFAFGTAEKPSVRLEYLKLDAFTECIDDPTSSHYNRIVNRIQVGFFDWESSEKNGGSDPRI